jgi:L-asparaginase II
MHFEPLIELTRNGVQECLHWGAVALTDTEGHVLAHVGNPHWLCFTRSTLKPLQALPLVHAGGAAHFGLNSQELAMLCASHNGEDMHVAQVGSILRKTGLTPTQMQCGCHVPYRFSFFDQPMPEGFVYDERHHNCSGKHSGFMAYCVQHGLPIDTYTEVDHPLQQAVRLAVADVAGFSSEQLRLGIDGCSAPNYAMPLSRLARCYARLARPQAAGHYGESLQTLSNAMTAHPELVSGTGRNDADFMRAGQDDWVSKVGADGVQVVGSRSRGQALAIKIMDGNKAALFAATVEALDQLGWLDVAQRAELSPWRAQVLSNVAGLAVGERRPVFRLTRGDSGAH